MEAWLGLGSAAVAAAAASGASMEAIPVRQREARRGLKPLDPRAVPDTLEVEWVLVVSLE